MLILLARAYHTYSVHQRDSGRRVHFDSDCARIPFRIDAWSITKVTAILGCIFAYWIAAAGVHGGDNAERVFLNANVISMRDQDSRDEAIAIAQGRIVQVGSNDEIRRLIQNGTETIDVAGRTIIPGLYAAHDHFPTIGNTALFDVDLNSPPIGNIESIADLIAALKARTSNLSRGEWILGRGYDDTLMRENRHPTRWDLDMVSTSHPIWIVHTSGHLGVANSKALEIAKVTRDTPQPSGGVIRKDEHGEPNGVFEEALTLVSRHAPSLTRDQRLATMEYCSRHYLSKGVTTTVIAGNGFGILDELQAAVDQGLIQLRIVAMVSGRQERVIAFDELSKRCTSPDRLRLGAVKMLADGSIQGYTGFLSQPYHRQPSGKTNYVGYPLRNRLELFQRVLEYHRAGYQIAIHGNGDAAIDDILSSFEAAQDEFPRKDTRHRIEHCQTPREDQLDRMKDLGVTPSFFVAHVYYWGDRHRDLFLGPERASRISPLASALRRQVRFSLHNDTPVTPVDPLHLVWCAAARETRGGQVLGPEQRIDRYAALRAVTIDAAWQNFDENQKGTLEAGKLADFVILSADPLDGDVAGIRNITVDETIVGGKTVYVRQP